MKLNKPRLLVLTDWYVPAFKAGGPVQSIRNLVESLKGDFEIYIFTGDRDFGDTGPYPAIETDRWLSMDGCQVRYASPEAQTFGQYKQLLKELQPATIYLNSLFSTRFTLFPLLAAWKTFNKKIVLAPRGMLHRGALQYKSLKKKLFLAAMRLSGLFNQIDFHATDEQEAQDIHTMIPKAKSVTVIPNFPAFEQVSIRKVEKHPGQLRLVFLSRIAPKKNPLFFLRLLASEKISAHISVMFAGAMEDPSYWIQCESVIKQLPDNISITLRSAVPHQDVLSWLQSFHIYILPTFGENFGHGIFEAFLAGKPVIISDQTPWRNLETKGLGWDIPLDQPKAFIKAIEEAAALDQDGYDRMSAACHKFAVDYRNNNETRSGYIRLFS